MGLNRTFLLVTMLMSSVQAFRTSHRMFRRSTSLLSTASDLATVVPVLKKKLATVERIVSVAAIKDADKIELATVLGWDVIVKKNEFAVGDYCVYMHIDTVLDLTKPWFSFLKTDRIKTIKMRGVYSQGLLLPVSDIPFQFPLEEHLDISEQLGVTKYEKPAGGSGLSSSKPFPSTIISPTDEDHLRSNGEALDELVGKEMYITLKMDGSSMTLIWDADGKFTLCSRRITLYTSEADGSISLEVQQAPMIDFAVKKNHWQNKLRGQNVAVQGEFCGPMIHGNQLRLSENQFFVFNVKNLTTGDYYSMPELKDFCSSNGFTMVPILNVTTCTSDWTIAAFQEVANAVRYETPSAAVAASAELPAEGIVVRPTVPFYSEVLHKPFSVKVINQNYKD